MVQEFIVTGMTCGGCKENVQNALLQHTNVQTVEVNLKEGTVLVGLEQKVTKQELQSLLNQKGHYHIYYPDETPEPIAVVVPDFVSEGQYYCPMQCEGNKTYSQPGHCPKCGMDLLRNSPAQTSYQFFCPKHPYLNYTSEGKCKKCNQTLLSETVLQKEQRLQVLTLWTKLKTVLWFTLPLFFIAMQEMISGHPMEHWLDSVPWNMVQFVLSSVVLMYLGSDFLKRGWASILRKSPNMWTLIAIGVLVTYFYSTVALFFSAILPKALLDEQQNPYLYFEAVAVILTFVQLGQWLEARSHRQTGQALHKLMTLVPPQVTVVREGRAFAVSLSNVTKGDVVRILPGDKIPVDGTVVFGGSVVEESMISGEPIPVNKKANDKVLAGTINGSGSFDMRAEKVGKDTFLASIVTLVRDASLSRAPIQNLVDKVAFYFVPVVVISAFVTLLVWGVFGGEMGWLHGLVGFISILIIACPCALGLATPMSIMVGTGRAVEEGILIKNAKAIEEVGKAKVLLLDKTGTLTEGRPAVHKVYSNPGFTKDEVLRIAGSLNVKSNHPLGQALVEHCKKRKLVLEETQNFLAVEAKGVQAELSQHWYGIGNEAFVANTEIPIPKELEDWASGYKKQANTVVYVFNKTTLLGAVAIFDPIRKGAKEMVNYFKNSGYSVAMLTGDTIDTAKAVAATLGISKIVSGCKPIDKYNEIVRYQSEGKKVIMIGDGVNDAPALALAEVSMAIGNGTNVAMETADITLLSTQPKAIIAAHRLSLAMDRNIKQNLFFAFLYNAIGIPLASGMFLSTFGIFLNPMIAAAAMSFSSVSVILNALRLKRITL